MEANTAPSTPTVEYVRCEVIPEYKYAVVQTDSIYKKIDGDMYTIYMDTVWKYSEGIYVDITMEEYNTIKDDPDYDINKHCLEFEGGLWSGDTQLESITCNSVEVNKDDDMYDKIETIINEEGHYALQDEYGWECDDCEYKIDGAYTIEIIS